MYDIYFNENKETILVLEAGSPLPEPVRLDYVDEYGVNHGPGVIIGETIWAPVNCGYKASTADSKDFPYGKLYQWGRKYGQGYSGVYDESVPELVEGPVMPSVGLAEENSNKFYYTSVGSCDWCSPQDDKLWNYGTEYNPVKTEYDPCPDGWRVPTYAELNELIRNYSSKTTDENGRSGFWLSGPRPYTESVPQVFFPAAGLRYSHDGHAGGRGSDGRYWSSRPGGTGAYNFYFYLHEFYTGSHSRALGESVRCVQE
jgi:uncharacterized protein (TIGR02145 family)